MALQRQIFSIPVSGGLDTKTDDKQVLPGKALTLENVRFQKTGKLQKRYGLVAMTTASTDNLFTTSTLKAVCSDDEYIAVKTSSGIYGYSKTENRWTKQVNYSGSFSIKTEYLLRNYENQFGVDQDTSIDGNYTVYGSIQGNSVNVILKDNQTGLRKNVTILPSRTTDSARVFCQLYNGVYRVVVIMNNYTTLTGPFSTIFYVFDSNLQHVQSGTVSGFGSISSFNATRDNQYIYVVGMTSTAGLVVRKLNFDSSLVSSGTFSDVFILQKQSSFALSAVSGYLHIVYSADNAGNNVYNIVAISPSMTLVDATLILYTKDDFFTPSCVFYDGFLYYGAQFDDFGTTPISSGIQYNKIAFDTVTGYGATSSLINYGRNKIATEPFVVNGEVYVILYYVFGTGIPNSKSFFILNITTGNISQVFSPELASAHGNIVSKTTVVGSKVYTGIMREISSFGSSGVFATIGSSSVVLDYGEGYFDNSRVKVDKRIYLCDGGLIELDKTRPHENGFVYPPYIPTVTVVTGTANPNVASKKFSYAAIYEYFDTEGQRTFSAPFYYTTLPTTSASASSITIKVFSPVGSMKFFGAYYPPTSLITSSRPRIVLYRTTNNGSVYYRLGEVVSDNDGSLESYSDQASDASITGNEVLYTTGGVLENNPAPAADFCFSGGNRIFLGGLEEKDEIAYSKKQLFGESVAFNDFYRIRVSTGLSFDRSPISAGGYMDGKIIIFRKQSIYFCQGDGPNELGVGSFSEPEIISSDAGCEEPRSVVNMPLGLMFKSKKGIYLLSRGLAVQYIGAEVEAYNQYNIYASILSEANNEVRFYLTTGTCLVYNYLFQSWSVFTGQGSTDADVWDSKPTIIKSSKIQNETVGTFTDDGSFYSMRFISPWLKLNLIQGYLRCYQLWIIGEFKSAHTLKCLVTADYLSSPVEDYSLIYNTTDSAQYQFQVSLPNQKVESIKFELYDTAHTAGSSGEAYELSNIQIEAGVKAGGYKLGATKSY